MVEVRFVVTATLKFALRAHSESRATRTFTSKNTVQETCSFLSPERCSWMLALLLNCLTPGMKKAARDMKAAIPLPDDLFERGEAFSKQRSLSRSELYVRAIREYLDRHDHAAITAQLNEVYADVDSALEPELEALSLETLRRQDWAK
jgi:predicted transcriptional regulator